MDMSWLQFIMHWLKASGQMLVYSFPFASLFFFVVFIVLGPKNCADKENVMDAIFEELEPGSETPDRKSPRRPLPLGMGEVAETRKEAQLNGKVL